MKKDTVKPVGLTKDDTFQVGARRTFPVPHHHGWKLIVSEHGWQAWLGAVSDLSFVKGATCKLPDGTVGKITLIKPESHIRLTWQPANWATASIMQIRVIPSGQKTVIALHQEKLPDAAARKIRRQQFLKILDNLEHLMKTDMPENGYR